jgi:hypothetical protein
MLESSDHMTWAQQLERLASMILKSVECSCFGTMGQLAGDSKATRSHVGWERTVRIWVCC